MTLTARRVLIAVVATITLWAVQPIPALLWGIDLPVKDPAPTPFWFSFMWITVAVIFGVALTAVLLHPWPKRPPIVLTAVIAVVAYLVGIFAAVTASMRSSGAQDIVSSASEISISALTTGPVLIAAVLALIAAAMSRNEPRGRPR